MDKGYSKSYYEKNKERLKEKARERRKQSKQHLSLVPVSNLNTQELHRVPETVETLPPVSNLTTPETQAVQEPVQAIMSVSNLNAPETDPVQEGVLPEMPVSNLNALKRPPVSIIELLKLITFIGLCTLLTLLLLHQMLEFYAGDPLPLRLMKALATEGLILFFSTIKSFRFLAVCMCVLSIYMMSAHQIETQRLTVQTHQAIAQNIAALERSIEQKETLQTEFVTKGWLTAARVNLETIDQFKLKLEKLRSVQVETLPQYSYLIGQLLTRVFFMIGNILIFQKLKQRIT